MAASFVGLLLVSACDNALEQGSALDGASETLPTNRGSESEILGTDASRPNDAGAKTTDDIDGTQINSENQTKGEADEMREAGIPETDTLTGGSNTLDNTSDGMHENQSNVETMADGAASPQETGTAQADAGSGDMPLARNGDVCRSPEECTNGGDVNDVWNVMTCFAPWQPRPMGTPPEPALECTTEEDCYRHGTNDGRFACQGGTCQQNCSSLGCVEGYRCGAEGRCELSTCETDAECPSRFSCGDTGTCERAECSSDEQCDGYCVNSRCSPDLGRCGYQTAA